nr:iron-containing alcohol dehydrogenase [Nesterenkonia sp. PF2B19]
MNHSREYSFELPTRIEFGVGVIETLAELVVGLGGRRVLLVSDPGLVAAGVVGRVSAILTAADLDVITFTEVEPEPEAEGVMAGARLCKDEDRQVVVGVGGGSALDTAKSIALMACNTGHIRDFTGLDVPSEPGLPVIAVPTTAGTGSECAVWSVISEKAQNVKYGIGGRNMTATVALCDPALSVSLPARLTIGTGLDALAHGLESYVNKATQPISEALSEKSMELIARSLRTPSTTARTSARVRTCSSRRPWRPALSHRPAWAWPTPWPCPWAPRPRFRTETSSLSSCPR